MRRPIIEAFSLPNVDERYTFYYDETNNVRKLHLTPNGMNIRRPDCFVLGGVVRPGLPVPIDLEPLHGALRLQSNIKEIKLKHLGSGGFLELLGSARVGAFLEWLTTNGFLVHYQVTDLLYWSIVDIVDSILAEADAPELVMVHPMLKDSLYALLRDDVDGTAELLGRYDYPNVGRERRGAFVAELLDLLEHREDFLEHFPYYMLKGLLQLARGVGSLPYLEDEAPNVLIDGFGGFVVNRLCLFKNSQHILDNEKQIETYLESLGLADSGKPLRHHRFADSMTEPGIQLSDCVAGLLGKLFTYLNRTPVDELEEDISGLSSQQERGLSLLSAMLDVSTNECPAFAHYIISAEDQRRAHLVLGR
jgi:hypothetical protein